MRFSFKFANQCGVVYKGGNVVFSADGNCLLSPVGNRVTVFDLVEHTSSTLPYENRKTIRRVALSSDSRLLITVDEDGRALVSNYRRRVVLHRFHFKKPVRDMQFSPDNRFVAVTHGHHVQVWKAPGLRREFAPFHLHRTYTGHHEDTTCIAWSPSGRYFATGSKDMSARIYSLDPVEGFVPITLMGHRGSIVGVYFGSETEIYTISQDAAVFAWKWVERPELRSELLALTDGDGDVATGAGGAGAGSGATRALATRVRHAVPNPEADGDEAGSGGGVGTMSVLRGEWELQSKHFFKQDHAQVCSAAFHRRSKLLVIGFSSGVFGLYEVPDCANIHTLSISQRRIHTAAINSTGEWLAFGSATLGQLLVWEWQSETYVLKQQGHFFALNSLAYSNDGQIIVTGGDDGKIKLWNTHSGFCFVTFKEHTAPVTGLAFIGGTTGSNHVVVSSSLDGTVRAFDLIRYRNFRTMTTPTPVQFLCVAADPSGEVVCAGALEPFNVYVWSLQTAKLLDVLSGHEGPVSSLSFNPSKGTLASGSWDRTVKVWDVFNAGTATETLQHDSDVLAVAYRPDGRELCASSRDGKLSFWNAQHSVLEKVINGRRDAEGGRKPGDRRTAKSSAAGKCFSSICYTADGECVLAGGRTKYVCIYAVEKQLLLKRFQLSHNRSIDGTVDKLNTKNLTEAGDINELDMSGSDDEKTPDESLPGVVRGDLSSRTTRPEIRSSCVRFSPTGRAWSAATTEGLLVYSLDDSLTFDPFELDEDVTPEAIMRVITEGNYSKALLMALHLNEEKFIEKTVEAVPLASVTLTARGVPVVFLRRLLIFVSVKVTKSPHLQFYLTWALALLQHHGRAIRQRGAPMLAALRALQRSILVHKDTLTKICLDNQFTLDFLATAKAASEAPADAAAAAATATATASSADASGTSART